MRHIAIAVLFACIAAMGAMPTDWVKPEGYAYTLSLYAQVLGADGSAITATGSTLAAFDANGVCRGMKAVATNSRGVTLYQMSVASNQAEGETLFLRIYDAGLDEVLEVVETLDFATNAVIPPHDGASQPMVYHVKAPVAPPSDWVKPEGYAYTLSLYAQVLDEDGNAITATGSTLAAFDANGICRGVKAVATNSRGVTLYQMSVASNQAEGETLFLRIFDVSRDEVLNVAETLAFTANAVIPPHEGSLHPMVYHVRLPFSPPTDWVKPEGYAYTMSLYAQVQRLDGTFVTAEGSTLAVFDAYGRCRGVKEVSTNARGVTLYQLSISSNDAIEQGLTLKIADAESREVFDIVETIDFSIDAIIPPSGGSLHPKVFHVKTPYAVETSLKISFSGAEDAVLDFAADGGEADVYSTAKDVLTLSEDAYIVGQTAGGGVVNLQKSTILLKDITRWRVAVAIEPGDTATIHWNAFDAEGRRAYLFTQDGSCVAQPMASEGSISLTNNGATTQTRFLTLVCATAEAMAEFGLDVGWNLVAFPFTPNAADASSLLVMRPMMIQAEAYVFADEILPNVGYWFFSLERATCVLERQTAAANPVFANGWQAIGVSQEMPSLPEGCSAFAWQGKRFTLVERLLPGRGYWLFAP